MYSSILLYINSNPKTTFRTHSSGDGGTGGNSNTNNSEIISPSEELSESQLSESQLRYVRTQRRLSPRGVWSGHETTVMGSELQLSEYVPSLVPRPETGYGNEASIYPAVM